MTAEFRRLGKRGAYRLGQLRAQGVGEPRPPKQFRPRFARHRPHQWSTLTCLVFLLGGAVVISAATAVGWWFVPFVAGVGAGLANRAGSWPWRVAVPAIAAMAAAGWAAPLWLGVLRGLPYGPVARVIAALTGLPADAAVGMVLTVAIAVVQAVTGYWLGRALTPRSAPDLFR
ncbi:MAG: hypothetical protein ACRDOK_19345 [Streptosporangiaceae bacterium]